MRLPTAAVIIAFVLVSGATPTDASAQLADFARSERARRVASGVVSDRVVTGENVRRSGTPVVVGRVGEVVPGAPAGEVDAGAGASLPGEDVDPESQDPAEALAQQQEIVQKLQDEELRLQLDINRERARFQAPVISQSEREQALAGMNESQGALEAVRSELAEASARLLVLQEAAAAASSP